MKTTNDIWFKQALEAMTDMVLIKGPNSKLLWGNKAFRDHYGMTEEELLDIVDADHSDPDNTLQYVIDDQTVFDSGAPLDIPREHVTGADGTTLVAHTIKAPIFEGDEVVRTVGVSRILETDVIAQRSISHDDAKAYVKPLRALTRCFPNPMLMVDIRARIVNASPLWHASFGRCEIDANSFFLSCYPDLEVISGAIDTVLSSRQVCALDIAVDKPRGGEDHFSLHISPWTFANGDLGGAILVATDVTVEHDRSKALQAANDELALFAYRASHDLKGPVSTTKALAQLIREDIQDGAIEEAAANASRIFDLMSQLEDNVLGLLDLAEADVVQGHATHVTLSPLFSRIKEKYHPSAEDVGIDLRFELSAQHTNTEANRLTQIVEILVGNAIKYHRPEGEGRFVQITAQNVQGGLQIEVRDNGPGIAEEIRDRIFDPFSRFSSDSSGAGLGLTIVKKHLVALHGQIELTSDGTGSTFQVFLPEHARKGFAA